jgi:hypothetical protein
LPLGVDLDPPRAELAKLRVHAVGDDEDVDSPTQSVASDLVVDPPLSTAGKDVVGDEREPQETTSGPPSDSSFFRRTTYAKLVSSGTGRRTSKRARRFSSSWSGFTFP